MKLKGVAHVPFVPVPNVVRAEVTGLIANNVWAHVLHYQYGGGAPSNANLTAGAQVLFTQFNTHLMPLAHDTVQLSTAKLTDLASMTGNQAEFSGAGLGGELGAQLGANVAFILQKNIGRRYKGGHPHAALPLGSSNTTASSNSWSATFVTSVTNAYAAFITATANGGMWSGVGPEVTVHRSLNHQALDPPVTDVVQSYTGTPLIGSQRRRIGR